MIELTNYDGRRLSLNPEHVILVQNTEPRCTINLSSGDSYFIQEPFEFVVAKINGGRLETK